MGAVPRLAAGFDVGHLAWAGADPVAMVTRYAGRVSDLHLKDLDLAVAAATRAAPTSYQEASSQRLFLEPGLGDIDLAGVIAALPEAFAGCLVIEVDRPSMEPDASARQSFAWVESVTATPLD
jgi:inosose dehydratase